LQALGEVENTEQAVPVTLPLKAEGVSTDIGGPLSGVANGAYSNPLMAVIWMGDGAQTLSPAKFDPQQIARQFARQDIPIYFVVLDHEGIANKPAIWDSKVFPSNSKHIQKISSTSAECSMLEEQQIAM